MMKMMDNDEARQLFQVARIGRLGCVARGEPYVVPISCYLEEDSLYSHSLPGQKITALREYPRACVQVDEIESDLRWRSAIAFGQYEEVVKPFERERILIKLMRKFPMLTPVKATITADATPPEIIVFRIKIERFTGVAER